MQLDSTSIVVLASKIKILKDKLTTYGWNFREIYGFILYDFMKLPKVNWEDLETTLTYYQIKEKYKVEPDAAELILCIRQIVPNFHSHQVLQYLHTMFDYSAIQYGIDVFDSSSDSSQNPRIVRKRHRNDKATLKRSRSIVGLTKTGKKVHIQSEIAERRQKGEESGGQFQKNQRQKQRQLRLVRKRKKEKLTELDELQKKNHKDDI